MKAEVLTVSNTLNKSHSFVIKGTHDVSISPSRVAPLSDSANLHRPIGLPPSGN